MPKYSVCIAHYNDGDTIRDSLQSILDQVDDDFEIIVVDNFSNDGSEKVLSEFADGGKIKLIRVKSSRGTARQIAFENSEGDYVFAHFDMDDVFNPVLPEILDIYHKFFEGKLLRIDSIRKVGYWEGHFSTCIAPSKLVRELGGWPDSQFGEDLHLWLSASKMAKYSWIRADLVNRSGTHIDRRGAINYFKSSFTCLIILSNEAFNVGLLL